MLVKGEWLAIFGRFFPSSAAIVGKSQLHTSRLPITNRGKPASDHFRVADRQGVIALEWPVESGSTKPPRSLFSSSRHDMVPMCPARSMLDVRGDQAQAVRYTRLARAKSPLDVPLMYSEGQVYALLGQPTKAIAAYSQAVAKGYKREEIWDDPENAKLQSVPEFVELCRTNPAK